MIKEIAYLPIMGLPLVVWGGITTVVLLLITLYLGYQGKNIKLHKTMAIITIIMGLGHGLIGFLAQL